MGVGVEAGVGAEAGVGVEAGVGAEADRCGSQRGAELCARAPEQRRDDEEGHDGQVLEEKDAEGGAAEARCELALLR